MLASCSMDKTQQTTLIIPDEEMNGIMKTIKSLGESDLLIKGAGKTIKIEAKEKKDRFFSMLLGILPASLLGSVLADKGAIRVGEEVIRAGKDF